MAAKQLNIHQHYLFSALVDQNGKRIPNQYKPVFNQLLLAADPKSAQLKTDKPVVLRTDKNGVLKGVKSNSLEEHLPYNQLLQDKAKTEGKKPDLPVIIPPLEVALYQVMTNPEEWVSKFIQNLKQNATAESPLESINLKWVSFKFNQLAEPNNKDPLSEADNKYKDWYNAHKSVKRFVGYCLPKKRGLFFAFTNKKLVDQISEIHVKPPNYKEGDEILIIDVISDSQNHDFFIGFLSGTEEELPVGMYTFKVIMEELPDGEQHWSGNVSGKDTTNKTVNDEQPSYSLAAMGRFDLNVPSGDFCLINADPISLEESLITQYPVQYAHIIDAGSDFKHLAKMKSNPSMKKSTGLTSYVKNLGLSKSYIDLANGIGTSKVSFSLAALVLKDFVMANFQKDMNVNVYNSLEHAFSLKSTHKAITAYHDAVDLALERSHVAGGWKPVGTKDFFTDWSLGEDDKGESKYAKTVGKYLKIPEEVFAGLGKVATVVGTATTALAVADGYAGMGRAQKNAKNSVKDLQTVMDDYMLKTGFRSLAQKEIKINFDTDKHDIKPEYNATLKAIADELITHKSVVLVIEGHTDWVGSVKYNQGLSERRAKAVKDELVKMGVVPDTRISITGKGELAPVAPNSTEQGRAANRRIISNYFTPSADGTACREGMQSCEQYRNLTLSTYLAELDSYVEMASKAMDAALAVLSVFPLTAPAALAITVAKAVGDNAKTMKRAIESEELKLLDEYKEVKKQMRHESSANQFLIRSMFKDKKIDDIHLPIVQTRLRAEAINGLMNLITRAVTSIEDDASSIKMSLSEKLKSYHVKEYINNFILNDQWLFPLKTLTFSTLSMDQMWLFATSKYNHEIDGVKNIKLSNGFSLNDQFQLIKDVPAKDLIPSPLGVELVKDLVTEDHVVRKALLDTTQMMSLFNSSLPNDVKADFHNTFPIHQFSTSDVETLAENFQISWPNITAKVYKYTAIYVRKNSSKAWMLLEDQQVKIEAIEAKIKSRNDVRLQTIANSGGYFTPVPTDSEKEELAQLNRELLKEQISPYDQFKVLVVFNDGDDGINGFVPVNLQVHRVDGHNAAGPVYKGLAKALESGDLEGLSTPGISSNELLGKHACIFSPMYQFGTLTVSGIKPLVSTKWLSVLGQLYYDDIDDYYKAGNLDDMSYSLQVNVGKGTKSKIWLPIKPTVYADIEGFNDPKDDYDNDDVLELINDDLPNEFSYNLSKERQGEAMMVQKEFLASNSATDTTDPLFDVAVRVIPLIRINGEGNPWIMADKAFDEEINSYTSPKISRDGNNLIIDGFNWRESVEFTYVLSCEKLLLDSYLKKGKAYLRAQGAVTFKEDADIFSYSSDCDGPTLQNLNFEYLGKADNGIVKTPGYLFLGGNLSLPKYFNYLMRPSEDTRNKLVKEPARSKQYADIIDILKSINSSDETTQEGKKSILKYARISGLFADPDTFNKYTQSSTDLRYGNNDGERFYYAAYRKMNYINPFGKKIDSIRPFGKDKITKTGESVYEYYKYEMINFNAVDLKISEVEHEFNNFQFHFSSPKSNFLVDQSWVESPDKETKQVIEASQKKQDDTDTSKKLSADEIYKILNEWLDDNSTQLKPQSVVSIESGS